ncbi:helix-turn-helix domain-containing protein [Nocardia noduli]|uniref:helix-turn-helix domain-containing protein n=1 Tax=Nocardia noduli TaxID=2815722 RepID=UPI001C23C22F|nr:helix-turn-helix transcriptional regulator [Nocardia noduli]
MADDTNDMRPSGSSADPLDERRYIPGLRDAAWRAAFGAGDPTPEQQAAREVLGAVLKESRRSSGLSRAAVAQALGLTLTAVEKRETGMRLISITDAREMTGRYHLDPDAFVAEVLERVNAAGDR